MTDGTLNGAGAITCTGVAATRVITCTTDGAITGDLAGSIGLAGIQSLWDSAGATNVADLTINDNAAGSGGDIALDTTSAVDDTTPEVQLTSSITLGANSVVGTAGTTTLTLTPPRALAATDNMVFTMPTNFSVPQGAITMTDGTLNGAGAITCTGVAATRVITCTTDGAITGDLAGSIGLAGIKSLWNSSGATNVANLTINDNAAGGGLDIALDATSAVDDTSVGALSSTNVEPTNLSVGTPSANTISFTTVTAVENLGKIVITYPSGFNVAPVTGVTASSLSGLDGTWTATVSGQIITLTQTGGGASAAGAKSLVLATGIVSPAATGSTGTYTITTTTAADLTIETDAAVAADIIASFSSSASSSSSGGGGGGGGSNSSSKTTTTKTTTTTTETPAKEDTTKETPATETTTNTETTTTDTTTNTTENGGTSSENSAPEPITIETKSGETITITDLSADFWATDMIKAMVEAGIVKGNPDGTFKPDGNLNRAETAALLYRVMGLGDPANPSVKPFTDVEIDKWYVGYVAELKSREVINGNPDGTYKPVSSINRAEFLKMAVGLWTYLADDTQKAEIAALEAGKVTEAYKDLDVKAWYAPVVTAATEKGWIGGKACGEDKCIDASAKITRAEATKILFQMFGKMLQVDMPAVEGN